jgi:hypothetical protein
MAGGMAEAMVDRPSMIADGCSTGAAVDGAGSCRRTPAGGEAAWFKDSEGKLVGVVHGLAG